MARSALLLAWLVTVGCSSGSGGPALDTIFFATPGDPFYADNPALFAFYSPRPEATFEARLDGGAFEPVANPNNHVVDDVPAGVHTFEARAVTLDGARDATPARFTWTVLPAIETFVDRVTLEEGLITTATLALSSNYSGATFEGRTRSVDPFASVSNPWTVVFAPNRVVEVRAVLPGGHVDRTPLERRLTLPDRVRVAFPPRSAVATQDRLVVRGAIDDPGHDVVRVKVGGVEAASSDGLRTWAAEVALAPGANRIDVVWETSTGLQGTDHLDVRREVNPVLFGFKLDVDDGGDRALVVDVTRHAVLGVDLQTGARSVVSGLGVGIGPEPGLDLPAACRVDPSGQRLLVIESTRLYAVDLDSGDREVIADSSTGSGPSLWTAQGLALHPTAGLAYVPVDTPPALLEVDLATGARRVVSDADTGSGAAIDDYSGAAWDPGRGAVLVVDQDALALVAIDPATGNRTVVSGGGVGDGPDLTWVLELRVHDGTAYLREVGPGNVYVVDLATGNRTLVQSDYDAYETRGFGLDSARNRAILSDTVRDRVVAVDLVTGAQTAISTIAAGDGPVFQLLHGLSDMDYHAARHTLYAVTSIYMVAIDPDTGDRTIVSSLERGVGPRLRSAGIVRVDPARDRLLATDDLDAAILAVDPDTGDRTVLTAASTAAQEDGYWRTLELDTAHDRGLIYTPRGAVYAFDLGDGATTRLVPPAAVDTPLNNGTHEWAVGIGYDPARDVLLVADRNSNLVMAVDLATGQRSVFATFGGGPSVWPVTTFKREGDISGLRVDPVGRFAYVLLGRGVVRVDLDTRASKTVTDVRTGRGLPPYLPTSLTLDRGNGFAFLAPTLIENGHRGIFAVDLANGDRLLNSK